MTKDKNDLVKKICRAGVKRHVALSLVYTASVEEATRRDIESATGLKQPEVSIATQDMREKGWMEKRNIMKEGKGRPIHSYSLAKSIEEIVQEIEEDERSRMKEMENNLESIRNLIKKVY